MMQARSERQLIRAAGGSRRYLLVNFDTPAGRPRAERLPVNVALVLDRSGSMEGEKIDLVRVAAARALQMLKPHDRFSLTVFDDRIDVLVGSSYATTDAVRHAERLLSDTRAGNSTDLFTGWMKGCEQAAAFTEAENITKCLLLTDGLANVGVTEPDEISKHASRLRELGVRTSTFGVGADFDERLLEKMSRRGGGHFYFIEKARQIPDLLASELGETLEIVARDVALSLRLPAGVHASMLSDFVVTQQRNEWRLGDLISQQRVTAVIALTFPPGQEGASESIDVHLSSRDAELFVIPPVRVAWTYAGHHENDKQRRNVEVDREVAQIYVARAQREALEANRRGDYERGRAVLRGTANRIESYACGDAALLELAASLVADEKVLCDSMPAMEMKRRHYGSATLLAARTPDGRARRGTPSGSTPR